MLFNSFEFLLLFLPISLLGFYTILFKRGASSAIFFIAVASLVFYAYWKPIYILLLLGSVAINYLIAKKISNLANKQYFLFGVVFNLCLLAYFKYSLFIVDNLNHLIGTNFMVSKIVLPLAISFFTFQQIAFLVDVYTKKINSFSFKEYVLFVSFFPQLIAGPIVHYKEMIPQFNAIKKTIPWNQISMGLMLLSIGFFKKVIIADRLGVTVDKLYTLSNLGNELSFIEAWWLCLAYSCQIYFDFSGYIDMAMGLAHLFGISLPINFNSPYQARNISEFWKRWHITLSNFLRDYLYIPLGGNHGSMLKQSRNLVIVMFLGGLWHGASWNFVIWGLIHGFLLWVFHCYKRFNLKLNDKISWMITFLSVSLSWIVFRAENLESANRVLFSLVDFSSIRKTTYLINNSNFLLLTIALSISLFIPNAIHTLRNPPKWLKQPHPAMAIASAALLVFCLLHITKNYKFIYFEF